MIRLLERWGYETLGRLAAHISYFWMGIVFLFFSLTLLMDAVCLAVQILKLIPRLRSFPGSPSAMTVFLLPLAGTLIISVIGYFSALNIRTEHLSIATPRIFASLGRVRIVQISDVHLGIIVRQWRLQRIITAIKAAEPDILVSTGDLVDGQINSLSGLAEDLAGNHDTPTILFTHRNLGSLGVLRRHIVPVLRTHPDLHWDFAGHVHYNAWAYDGFINEQDAGGLLFKLFATALTCLALAFLYRTVPNRKVEPLDAAIGGTLAGLGFEAMKSAFASFITHFGNYKLVYGAFAGLPVFLLWIYMSWIIVLAGAVITAAIPFIRAGGWTIHRVPGSRFIEAMQLLRLLVDAHRDGEVLALPALAQGPGGPGRPGFGLAGLKKALDTAGASALSSSQESSISALVANFRASQTPPARNTATDTARTAYDNAILALGSNPP
jgi:hypothetical protein